MFKLTVEDVFVIKNRGVVATGRVERGTLRVGDTVHINGGPASPSTPSRSSASRSTKPT
jgi:translation elongation factor EF-Tu-like GTPase